MPLVRFEVKNEYGLGSEEMYRRRGGSDEDPKSILEGLTVAGLVGILRQLGDLAEFASEVFHDLQEEVMETAARSHKMIARVKKLEESIPPIEKAILAQKSHIHFAYIDGTEWHPRIQTRKNQIVYSYLPHFIMDTYEECRDPPDFHLLDKFDKGGPGSCARRYSDPSYFKRALAKSEMLSGVKGQREKKARKSRKKGGRQRNGEVSYSVSASGRIQSESPTSCSESSAAETNCTVNMRSKSELGDRSKYFDPRIMEVRSTSLDLRTKLGYHEYVFDGSSSNQHEDQEDSELSSPRSNLQTDGTGSVLAEEREKAEYDGFSNRSSLAPSVRKSSSVTWDEKIEIMKPMHQKLHGLRRNVEKASNVLPLRSGLIELEKRSPTRSNIGAVPTLSDFIKISGTVFYDNESDELESEADSYVDALNTMESEVDTDVDRQTKQEIELSFAKFKNERIKDFKAAPTRESNARMSESSDIETDTASYTSSNKQMPRKLSKSIDSEDLSYVKPPQVNAVTSVNDPSSSGSNIPNSEGPLVGKNVNHSGESDESQAPAKDSDAPPVTFWTNGGLLGLQPSKPPDYRKTSTEIKCRSGTKNDKYLLPNETCVPKSHSDGLDMLGKAREHEEKNHNYGRGYDGSEINMTLNDGSTKQNIDSSAHFKSFRNKLEDGLSKKNPVSVAKIENSGDSHYNNVVGNGLSETSRLKAGLVKLQDHHTRQEGRNRVAYQTSPEKNFKKQIDPRSPMNSACSSPPLVHMKISVHPMNVSETSFLKLKFPDGKHLRESSENFMFPTFQLLPELSNSLQGIGEESDEDTLYRSSPDMSEEHMSQCSASNSDQWDSDEIPGPSNPDPKLYDSLCRVSSDESISSLLEHEGKIANDDDTYRKPDRIPNNLNRIQSMPDGPVLDCQSFDVGSQLTNKHERKMDSHPKDDLDLVLQYSSIPTLMPCPGELAPPLPPLPPLEWRLVKPPAQENEEAIISKASGGLKNLQVSEATPIQQPKLNQSEKTPLVITPAPPYSQHKQHMLGRSVTMQDSNGKDLNEREDLLHQIRSKSFNLRRTVPARPDLITAPTSNTKVAEMLQKANAIRQAFVGSDDGEDGSWSES